MIKVKSEILKIGQERGNSSADQGPSIDDGTSPKKDTNNPKNPGPQTNRAWFRARTPAKVSGPTPSMESPFGFLGKNKSVEILKTPPHVRIALSASAECPSNDGRGFGSEEIPTAVEVQHIASVFGPERSRWFGAPFGTRSDGESPKRGRGDSELLGRSIDAWPSFTAPAASVSLTPPPSSFVDHAIRPEIQQTAVLAGRGPPAAAETRLSQFLGPVTVPTFGEAEPLKGPGGGGGPEVSSGPKKGSTPKTML